MLSVFLIVFGFMTLFHLSETAAADADHAAIMERCQAKPDKAACYQEELGAVLRSKGPSEALEALDYLAVHDSDVTREAHPYAHHLGRQIYAQSQNFAKAFPYCEPRYASGCYHGVLEEFLNSQENGIREKDIADLCKSLPESQRQRFLKFQCLHGLGHGLTMYFNHDVFIALPFCDALGQQWDRDSCYGGVFMENIIHYQHLAHGHGHPSQNSRSPQPTLLDPQDPHYPCNILVRKYQGACYFLQSSAILTLNGWNIGSAFKECDKAPEDLIPLCYQSMGRDISGANLAMTEKTIDGCMQGILQYRTHCFKGAVNNFILTYANHEPGVNFCQKLADDYKTGCYESVGRFLIDLYPDQSTRDKVCNGIEERYITSCKLTSRQ
jgi:hypothetical protein